MPFLGASNIRYLVSHADSDGREPHVPLLSDSRLHEVRRRAEVVGYHAHGIKVRGHLGFVPHETEHVHGLLIERCDGYLPRGDVAAVPSPARCDPDGHAALLQAPEHGAHGGHVLPALGRLGIRVGIDVLLRVDAEEVPSHGKGHGEGIRGDLVTGHISNFGGEVSDIVGDRFEEAADHLRIRLGLVIGEEDDIFARLDLLPRPLEIVLAQHHGLIKVHGRPEEIAPGLVKVDGGVTAQHAPQLLAFVTFVAPIPAPEGHVPHVLEAKFATGPSSHAQPVLHTVPQRPSHLVHRLHRRDVAPVGILRPGFRRRVDCREVFLHEVDEGYFEGRVGKVGR
mmetsp:Transcript_11015/g.27093  ORF Transcript_11015/g.27093 Transcript_11015/m.27093 type:complete len:338 (+) Transcript_11015:327-1340(+)